MKKEPTTLFTDTQFVAWNCQAIFPVYPLTQTERLSVKPLELPVINFKRLTGMKSNYATRVHCQTAGQGAVWEVGSWVIRPSGYTRGASILTSLIDQDNLTVIERLLHFKERATERNRKKDFKANGAAQIPWVLSLGNGKLSFILFDFTFKGQMGGCYIFTKHQMLYLSHMISSAKTLLQWPYIRKTIRLLFSLHIENIISFKHFYSINSSFMVLKNLLLTGQCNLTSNSILSILRHKIGEVFWQKSELRIYQKMFKKILFASFFITPI